MLSKRLRERIRLLPHESGRVRRGSLKEVAAGDLKPGGRQNPRHDIGDQAIRLAHRGQPPRRGVLKLQNSSEETSPPLEVRNSPQSDRAGSLREFPGLVIATRRRSVTSTVPALSETATSVPQPECTRTPMAARFMSEVY